MDTMTDVNSTSQEQTAVDTQQVDTQADQQPVDIWSEEFDINQQDITNQPETTDGGDEETTSVETQEDQQSDTIDWEARYKEQLGNSDAKLDKPILLKVKGKVIEIDSLQDIRDLAERGTAATQKFQEMSEQRKFLEKLSSMGISPDNIDMVLAGEIQPQPVDSNTNTNPEAEAVAQEILASQHADSIKSALSLLPDNQAQEFATNPQFLRGLKSDYDAGVAQKIMPLVEKYVLVKGMPFLEAYAKAGQEMLSGNKQEKAKTITAKPTVGTSVKKQEPTDVWSMDDETFRRAMANVRN